MLASDLITPPQHYSRCQEIHSTCRFTRAILMGRVGGRCFFIGEPQILILWLAQGR